MTLKSDTKFGEESTCRSKIDMGNLTNFDPSCLGLKKYRGVIFHDTEE